MRITKVELNEFSSDVEKCLSVVKVGKPLCLAKDGKDEFMLMALIDYENLMRQSRRKNVDDFRKLGIYKDAGFSLGLGSHDCDVEIEAMFEVPED